MDEIKWRFPASNHSERKGISSGDTEAFRGAPYKAFAREILQNSIDARASDEEPTVVEFKVFEIKTQDIPGYRDLKASIRRCKEFWEHKKDYVVEYDTMLKTLEQDKITCLRVSDFNTTGLVGVETTNQTGNKFLALTKGTGVSEKTGSVSAGSKGVGKNAAFLMSSIRTVFYSTRTNQRFDGFPGECIGSIGVSELVSGYLNDEITERRDYTQGTGYYSSDNYNSAIKDYCRLDSTFLERDNRFGTDIYILGFSDSEDWGKEVINSILDSFMATIVRGHLEIYFNDMEISKNTVKDIVYNDEIINKNNRSNIVSQYRLLTDGDNVRVYDIDTDYGTCQLLVLPLSKQEEELATHKCVMIRHPLMKIKEESLGQSFKVSAMCIINDGKLGEILRSIENPQHIDWETKRIKDKSQRREVEMVLRTIKEEIRNCVIECLQLGDDSPIDPSGAGDFLPDIDLGEANNDIKSTQKMIDNVNVSKPKDNITVDKKADQPNDFSLGLEPDVGGVDTEENGDVMFPIGENKLQSENRYPGQENGGEKEGEDIIFKRSKLSGVKYRVISVDKSQGKMRIIFTAPIDSNDCYLVISLLDDSNNSSSVKVLNMKCNNSIVVCDNLYEFGPFPIKTNERIILDIETNVKGYFASGVKVVCK